MPPTKRSIISVFLIVVFVFLITSHSAYTKVEVLQTPLVAEKNQSRPYAPAPPEVESHFTPPGAGHKHHSQWNDRSLRALSACIARDNCGDNQKKVVLLASHYFIHSFLWNFHAGEGIWAMSMYNNFKALGYTTLFAENWAETLKLYRMMPDLVKVIIRQEPGECQSDSQCVKSQSNPSGIPAWKLFEFQYFPSHGGYERASKLGGQWLLSAVPDPNPGDHPIQYIGYSIEEECSKIPVIPLNQRKDRAWLMMKYLMFVHDNSFAWNRSYFTLAHEEMGADFIGAWDKSVKHNNWNHQTTEVLPDIEDREHGVTNLGADLPPARFFEEVGSSKLMIGMGNPVWSPSPFNALCQGVPFINPVGSWDSNNRENRTRWYTQHPALNDLDPPYVYHVYAKDYPGFISAIKTAFSTEIGRFIPKHMTQAALQERLRRLVDTDWREEARKLLDERLAAGNGAYVFEL